MAFPRAVDTKLSIDTISEISQHEASPVTSTSPRTAFEQQLCTHLLNLSEVTETLADRVMALEARLAEVEESQLAEATHDAIHDDAGELLSASEEKVRLLRDRLAPAEVVALHADETSGSEPEGELDQAIEEERVEDEAISDAAEVDTEYVDDPQIDLLSA